MLCKHQVAAAELNLTAPMQLFDGSAESRKQLAIMALGEENVKESLFAPLVPSEVIDLDENCTVMVEHEAVTLIDSQVEPNISLEMDESDFVLPPLSDSSKENMPPKEKANEVCDDLLNTFKEVFTEKVQRFGNSDTLAALKKACSRLSNINNPNTLNSFLHTMGSTVTPRHGKSGSMIPCQPTSISRRGPGVPRGAASVHKGRRPDSLPVKTAKRARNLALAIATNHANGKSHGTGH